MNEVVHKAKRIFFFGLILFVATAGCAGVLWVVWFLLFRKNAMNPAYQHRKMLREHGQ